MKLISYLFPRTLERTGSQYNTNIEVREHLGKNVLLVNGIVQTGPYTDRLWNIGLGNFLHTIQAPERILILGVGGGTLFHEFRRKFPEAVIMGVDIDDEIIRLGKKYFGLAGMRNVTFIAEDAKTFVRRPGQKNTYDLIVIDIYVGNDVPAFVEDKTFLSGTVGLLKNGGHLVINYFSQRNQQEKSLTLAETLRGLGVRTESNPVLRNIFVYVVK